MSEVAIRDDDRRPWERQRGETAKQYEAFLIFRNLEPGERTIRAAARLKAEIGNRNADTVERQFKGWSAQRHWHDRVEAFDVDIDRKRLQARETERQRIDREQAAEGRFLRAAAMRRFVGGVDPRGHAVAAVDWNAVDADSAGALYRLGRDTERTAAGLGLGASVGMIPVAQARQVVQEVFETMLDLIPEDLRSTAYSRVQAISDGR